MSSINRHEQIMKHLLDKKRVFVSDLSAALDVTEETIRRDLRNLELAGKVKRIRGGAELVSKELQASSIETESGAGNTLASDSIAKQVRSQLRNGMTIMIAGAELTKNVLSYIDVGTNLTVITNSQELIEKYGKKLYGVQFVCTGGEYDPKTRCFYGTDALRAVARHNVDLTLFACDVFSNYPTYENDDDAEMVEAMLNQSNRGILLVANSQFDDQPAAVNGPNYRLFDTIISDMAPPEDWTELFESRDVDVLYPEQNEEAVADIAEETEEAVADIAEETEEVEPVAETEADAETETEAN